MNLEAAEIVLGAATILAMAAPAAAEEPLLLPEHRDWLGGLRRLRPAFRRRADAAAGAEAETFVAELHAGPDLSLTIEDLPSYHRTIEVVQVADEAPPWDTAPFAPAPVLAKFQAAGRMTGTAATRRREAPTIVMEKVRPAIERDLGLYLKSLRGYSGAGAGDEPFS